MAATPTPKRGLTPPPSPSWKPPATWTPPRHRNRHRHRPAAPEPDPRRPWVPRPEGETIGGPLHGRSHIHRPGRPARRRPTSRHHQLGRRRHRKAPPPGRLRRAARQLQRDRHPYLPDESAATSTLQRRVQGLRSSVAANADSITWTKATRFDGDRANSTIAGVHRGRAWSRRRGEVLGHGVSGNLAADFTATIDFGGRTGAPAGTAIITGGGQGNFTVSGGHTYADEGVLHRHHGGPQRRYAGRAAPPRPSR